MKTILYIISFICLGMISFAQTVDGRFVVQNNDGTNYSVKVQIKLQSGTVPLGDATIRFTYNASSLSFPLEGITSGTDYTFHNFSGGNYSTATVTATAGNEVSLNITNPSLEAGTDISSDYIDVATLNFTVQNPSGQISLEWTNQEFYTLTSTLMENGIWGNDNSSVLPVELTQFTATAASNTALLRWQTATELNNYGFEIERKSLDNNTNWSNIGFVKGNGTSSSPKNYEYTDKSANGGYKFAYRLKQIDNDGSFIYSELSEVELIPASFELSQNYPNPFNPSTRIKYILPFDSHVTLTIFNTLGEKLEVIENSIKSTGLYEANWNASGLASGVYLYRIEAKAIDGSASFTSVKKMMLTK